MYYYEKLRLPKLLKCLEKDKRNYVIPHLVKNSFNKTQTRSAGLRSEVSHLSCLMTKPTN